MEIHRVTFLVPETFDNVMRATAHDDARVREVPINDGARAAWVIGTLSVILRVYGFPDVAEQLSAVNDF